MTETSDQVAAKRAGPSERECCRETAAIKSDTDLMDEIKKGRRKLNEGKARSYTLDELVGE